MEMLRSDIHQVRRNESNARIDAGRGREPAMDRIYDMRNGQTDHNSEEYDVQEIHSRPPKNEPAREQRRKRKPIDDQTRRVIDEALSLQDRGYLFGYLQTRQ